MPRETFVVPIERAARIGLTVGINHAGRMKCRNAP
jgi:hypothetical protein